MYCGDVTYEEGKIVYRYEVNCDGAVGKYVKVVHTAPNQVLTLCEVKVFGAPIGRYNFYLA